MSCTNYDKDELDFLITKKHREIAKLSRELDALIRIRRRRVAECESCDGCSICSPNATSSDSSSD